MHSIKNDMALAMYYAGESKTFIRKKLNVKVKRLNKWISEDTRPVKEQVLHMYFFGYSKSEIYKAYNLSSDTLDSWLDEAYDDIKSHTEKEELTRQSGRSQWTSRIINETVYK